MSTTAKTDEATEAVLKLSKSVRFLCKADTGLGSEHILTEMLEEMKVLAGCFQDESFHALEGFTSALTQLTADLLKDPKRVSLSPLRTLTHALDFLRTTFASGTSFDQLAKAPLNVLALDDNPVCLKALMMSLRSSAIKPKSCSTVKSALALVEVSDFDVIFSDITMPEVDGIEFCSQVRKLPKCKETPLIFVTGVTDFATRSRSKLSGGCDFVAKPFVSGEILLKAFTFDFRYRMAQAKGPSCRQEMRTLKGVASLDEQGKVKSINEEGARLLGYLPAEIINWHIDELVPQELQCPESLETIRLVLAGESKFNQAIDIIARRKDGTQSPLVLRFGEQRTENKRTLICIFHGDQPDPNDTTLTDGLSNHTDNAPAGCPADTNLSGTESPAEREAELRNSLAILQQTVARQGEDLARTESQLLNQSARQGELESNLSAVTMVEAGLREELLHRHEVEQGLNRQINELEEKQRELQATINGLTTERNQLEAKARESASAQAVLAEREGCLRKEVAQTQEELVIQNQLLNQTQAQLAIETERRSAAEGKVAELARAQTEEPSLKDRLAETGAAREMNLPLEAKLAELTAAHDTLLAELTGARDRFQEEEPQRRRLAAMVLEEQAAKAKLQCQFEVICAREEARQTRINSLEQELREHLTARNRLESLLESETVERQRLEGYAQKVQAELDDVSIKLEAKATAQQEWSRREAGLETTLRRLQEELTNSSALLTIRETETRAAKERIDELGVVQSSLRGKLKDQAARELALVEYRRETSNQLEIAQRQIEEGQRKLAALRDAAGEAYRLMSAIGGQRLQQIRCRLEAGPEVCPEITLGLGGSPR